MSNRNFKDSMFVDLFSKDIDYKKNFISLYNALSGSNYSPETTTLQSVKLEKVLYMSFINDVSMLIDDKIVVLIEHQSTINENMPLRFLEYVTHIYEKILSSENKYSKKMIKIPTPEFYVLYNGEEDYPIEKTLKLSDAFKTKFSKSKILPLEIYVKVININTNKGKSFLAKCNVLNDYEYFVEKVRVLKKENKSLSLQDILTLSINECRKEKRLSTYLERKSTEVINMIFGEYDYDTDIRVQRREAFEDGMEKGIARGVAQGVIEGERLGEKQATYSIAKAFLNSGFDINAISKCTGLSVEEIYKLSD